MLLSETSVDVLKSANFENEYFLSIGLNSNIKESDFTRNKLNLVVVLDVSGSMSSSFSQYYYDSNGKKQSIIDDDDDGENIDKSKLEIAKDAVCGLLDHLNDDDRFGMVLFDSTSYLAKPLNLLKINDRNVLKSHIKDIKTMGSTNFEAGYRLGTQLFEDMFNNDDNGSDESNYDNRIIFLTDAMPNTGDINSNSLLGLTKTNADNENVSQRIYSTFIGIGVDFNTKLIDYITKIRGSNYYSVHSFKQFLSRMDNEFEYMVTPLVFDLKLILDSDNLKIDSVYGSNNDEKNNNNDNNNKNEIMYVSSLFASAKSSTTQETKGGIILAKLLTNDNKNNIHSARLSVSYQDRNGKIENNQQIIQFNPNNKNNENNDSSFDNNGIRKAVLLTRYVTLLHEWIDDAKNNQASPNNNENEEKIDDWNFNHQRQSKVLRQRGKSQWERTSNKLSISEVFVRRFSQFKDYFIKEMQIIGDETLQQEVDIIDTIININLQ